MFNSNRFSLARRRRGLSKKALADRIGVTPRALSDYESGRATPREATLDRITIELKFPREFFFLDDPAEVSNEASFRSLSRMTAAQRDAALAAGSIAVDLTRWIQDRFHLPRTDIPDFRHLESTMAALALRAEWGLGEQPVPNLVHLMESKGVRVFSLAEDCHEVDAFSTWCAGVPFVFLNTRKSAERSRYDAAHELGHLVMHRHADFRGSKCESEADRFAASFLMPHDGFIGSEIKNPPLEWMLQRKRKWKVAITAYVRRLHETELLSDWHYRQICKKWRTSEPMPLARESSQLLRKVFDQLRSSGIARSDVSQRLGINPDELTSLMFGLVITGVTGAGRRSSGKKPQLRLV